MSKATETIPKIAKAIEKYGTDIQIKEIVIDMSKYSPYPSEDQSRTPVFYDSKALINSLASEDLATSMPKELINNYRLAMKLQTTISLDTSKFIVYDNKTYEILFVSKKILQGQNLLYEILVG